MESENGVSFQDEKEVVIVKSNEEGSSLDMNKENINCSHEAFPDENELGKDEIKDKGGLNSSGPEFELSESVQKIKTSNHGKISNGNGPKNNKLTKNQSFGSKAYVVFGRSTKPSLSQSLSFPAKGRHSDAVMKRSIEVYPTNVEAKHAQKMGSKVESRILNGKASNGPFPAADTKDVITSANAAKRRATIASFPCLRKSLSAKHVSANGKSTNPALDVLVEQDSETENNALPVKEDEDARSTTSSYSCRR